MHPHGKHSGTLLLCCKTNFGLNTGQTEIVVIIERRTPKMAVLPSLDIHDYRSPEVMTNKNYGKNLN